MEKIRSMASAIMGNSPNVSENRSPDNADATDAPFDMQTVTKMMSALSSGKGDPRTELLLALKPHLSAERAARVDNAVKLMRLIPLLPLVKELF